MKCCLLYFTNIFSLVTIIVFVLTCHCAVAEEGYPPVNGAAPDDTDNVHKHITNFLNSLHGSAEETSVECKDNSLYCAQFHAILKYQCEDKYFGQAIQTGCPQTCNQCGGNKGNPLIHSHQATSSSGSSHGVDTWSSEEVMSYEDETQAHKTSQSKEHKHPTSSPSTEKIIPSSASVDPELEAFDVVDEENPSDTNLEDYGNSWTEADEAEAEAMETPQEKNEKSESSHSGAAVEDLHEQAKSLLTKSSGKSSPQNFYSTSEEYKKRIDAKLWDYSDQIRHPNSDQVQTSKQSHEEASSADSGQEYMNGVANNAAQGNQKRSLKYY